jgi:tight adherence protein B
VRRVAASFAAAGAALAVAHSAAAGIVGVTPIGRLTFPERGFLVDFAHRVALRPSDVQVRENGRLVPDPSFVPVGRSQQALGVVLVVDASDSMRGTPIRDAFAAARTFVGQVAGPERVGLVTFAGNGRVVVPVTSDRRRLAAGLTRPPRTTEGTHIYDAVALALSALRSAKLAGGAVVVLSDGADTGSHASARRVEALARNDHVRIFTIGLRSAAFRPAPLRDVAAATGGTYSQAGSSADLAPIYRAIGGRLAAEYVLRYRSTAAPGEQVQVLVEVRGGGEEIVSYIAPKPHVASPFYRSPLSRFWGWSGSFAVIALLTALLVFGGAFALLRGPRSTLRARVADFVSMPGSEEKARQPLLTGAILARTERSLSRARWWRRFREELEIAEITIPPEQIVAATVVLTLVAAAVLVQLAPVAAVLALGVPLAVRALCRMQLRKVRDRFSEQLPDNLQVLASALRAGHSFIGALAVVAADADAPSRREFQRVVADEQLGVPIEDSLREAGRRMGNPDLEQVAVVAELQRHAGGNMAEVLDRVVETIRSRFDLRRLVQTLTAQGRLARWIVSVLPVVLLAFISLINPAYAAPLFSTGAGEAALVVAAVMIVAGSYVIKRIVDIKV